MTAHERGNAHVARGEWKEAVACYREAIATAASDAGARIGLAFALLQMGERQDAREILGAAVAIDPSQADAHYLLGQIARDAGEAEAAVAHFRDAIYHRPSFIEAHRDVIQLLLPTDPETTISAATRAIEVFPQEPEFWFYLGAASEQTADIERAVASYQRAAALRPDAVPARAALARILGGKKRFAQALPHVEAWAALAPDDPDAHMLLGSARFETGNVSGAIESYRRSLDIRHQPSVEFIVASLTGKIIDRAPDEYVAQLFDEYAETFDEHLVDVLKYDIPKRFAAMILRQVKPGSSVLDLGCGTGLIGAELVDVASHLVGVDLSPRMLQKARERNIYSRLEQTDLLAMMEQEAGGTYDLVTAMDVFVYVGNLDAIYAHVFRLLRPSGFFAFSVEALEVGARSDSASAGYKLHERGRYVHKRSYLDHLRQLNGFALVEMRDVIVRKDSGKPVPGYMVLFRRPAYCL